MINLEDINNEIEFEDKESGVVIQKPFLPSDINISTPPMNMGDLIDMIENRWINFGTDYQREENLWTPIQQSRLIESILLGLRLPAFYFEVVEKRKWNIIDGLQRCCAIRNFCVDKTLSLSELEFIDKDNNNFEGKKYDDFPFDIKRDIRMLPITVNLLDKGTPDEVKYILFKRLNTGGIELTPQEIRNAVYSGPAIDIIKRMSKYTSFLDATCYKIPTRRKIDMDFVSRFVAFYVTDYRNYKPDLDSFINQAMENIKNGNVNLNKMANDFNRSMLLCKEVFGDRAFRRQSSADEPKRPLNKAVFEVVSVLFSKLSEQEAEKLISQKENFVAEFWNKIKEDPSFSNSFSGGTGRSDSVKKRFSNTQTIINSFVSNDK